MKTNPSQTNSFSDPKGEVSDLKAPFKNRADKIIFHLDSHENTADGRATDFFFRKNWFFLDKKS
jgi:hypothetical protein